MKIKKIKTVLTLFLILSLYLSSCSDDNGGTAQFTDKEKIISNGTTDTIVNVSVDDFEIPIYLSIPEGCENECFPAVVVMHGSGGMWSQDDPATGIMSGNYNEWKEILSQNCIVGAFVDSYSPRGVTTRTGKWQELPNNFRISAQFVRPKDANATLNILQNLKREDGSYVVHGESIVLLGFSDGASSVAATLMDTDTVSPDFEWTQSENGITYSISEGVEPPSSKPEHGFAGGIFYYGGSVGYNYWGKHPCNLESLASNVFYPYAPMLYQIPSEGYLTENTLCMIEVLQTKGAPIELEYYEGVGHGFDDEGLPASTLARENTINWIKNLLKLN